MLSVLRSSPSSFSCGLKEMHVILGTLPSQKGNLEEQQGRPVFDGKTAFNTEEFEVLER